MTGVELQMLTSIINLFEQNGTIMSILEIHMMLCINNELKESLIPVAGTPYIPCCSTGGKVGGYPFVSLLVGKYNGFL